MLTVAINGGMVIDSCHRSSCLKNIGIQDGKIVTVTEEKLTAKRVIDASGLVVSPGFIDVHGHVDGNAYAGELCACQGITTTVGGNCGLSPVDMGKFFLDQEQKGFPINQAELIGHTFSLRQAVGIKDEFAPASTIQIEKMEVLARAALDQGACGLSFGLDYAPGTSMEELIRLAGICKEYKRICPVHSRLYTKRDLYSLFELFTVAKKTGVEILLSHFVYQYCSAFVKDALLLVDKARESGLIIHLDSGMYTNWATYIGTATFDKRSMHNNGLSLSDMIIASGKYYGRWMTEELYDEMRAVYPNETVIYCEGCPEDVYACLLKSYSMPSTDAGPYPKGEGHPQIAGTFPKYIHEMVYQKKLLSIEEAISKATYLPAEIFGFPNKGQIKEGMDADLVLFDLDHIQDKAGFPFERGKPDEKPDGILYVFVNGYPVVDNNRFTGQLCGQIIRK